MRQQRKPTDVLIDAQKETSLLAMLGGSSISANPKYLAFGKRQALEQLKAAGLIELDLSFSEPVVIDDKTGEKSVIDPGDSKGRYRLTDLKRDEADEWIVKRFTDLRDGKKRER